MISTRGRVASSTNDLCAILADELTLGLGSLFTSKLLCVRFGMYNARMRIGGIGGRRGGARGGTSSNFYVCMQCLGGRRSAGDIVGEPQMAQYDRENVASSHGGRGGGGYRGRGGWGGDFRGRGGRGGFRPRPGVGYKKSYSDEVREEVQELFGKKFTFRDEDEEWHLPPAEGMFQDKPFAIKRLLKLKEQLNTTKEKLNNKEIISWHRHTYFTNCSGIVVPAVRRDFNPEMCTQGWAKFHEILVQFGSLVSEATTKLHSVHLCEAPGGFVASLNHFLKTHRMDCDWNWRAMTLNPYYEGESPFRPLVYTHTAVQSGCF